MAEIVYSIKFAWVVAIVISALITLNLTTILEEIDELQ